MKKLLLGIISVMAVAVFALSSGGAGTYSASSSDAPSEAPIQPPI